LCEIKLTFLSTYFRTSQEGIAFAVRCWGWWNERRRNAV